MKFGVVVFPGSNCDRDLIHVLENVLQQEVKVIWHKDKSLPDLALNDCIMLPGGFSYGDYLRSGAIARFSPVMNAVVEFANSGGFVWGICNGFQILCEAGLLPGALLRNIGRQFICKNVFITPAVTDTAVTSALQTGSAYKIPIAHAEGRFYADQKTLAGLQKNKQIIFQYCDENGQVNDAANPNGALLNIAGICNQARNVFGMMPHPERASEDILGNTDGRLLFESFIRFADAVEVDVMDNLLR
ncbi:MAG: phosphoribosylformylglycinamidine synthase subunit PurQ [Chitinophagales bacterium]|nr:phosphoribosylformylglycinamidine synthase subunit PurQ [Chitinophagales bacterium]